MGKKKLIKKVRSLSELNSLAKTDPAYRSLAVCAAENLGGVVTRNPPSYEGELQQAMAWLHTNAMETDEDGVVAEVNFCRDLV